MVSTTTTRNELTALSTSLPAPSAPDARPLVRLLLPEPLK